MKTVFARRSNGPRIGWSSALGAAALVALAALPMGLSGSLGSDLASPPVAPALPADGPQPDLMALDLTWSPAEPLAGDAVTFTARVQNGGNASAGASHVGFRLDGDAALGDIEVPALAPGENATITSEGWIAVEGNHTIRATADVLEAVEEGDEGNNAREEAFDVAAREPDLVVVELAPSPPDPEIGNEVTFQARVRNNGTGDAGRFAVSFRVGNESLGRATIHRLAAGEEASVTSEVWIAEAGRHLAAALADADHDVVEANEANNERQLSFRVRGFDVELAPNFQEAHTLPGQSVRYHVQVSNVGLRTDTVRLRAVVASPGWTAEAGAERVTLAPDETVDVLLVVTAPLVPTHPAALQAIAWLEGRSVGDPEEVDAAFTQTSLLPL